MPNEQWVTFETLAKIKRLCEGIRARYADNPQVGWVVLAREILVQIGEGKK